MESRANYAAIGGAVLAIVVISIAFMLWLTNAGERAQRVAIRVIFPGAVTGLNTGSAVLFNGIRIGEVSDLQLDPDDPSTVVAMINVDRTKPIRTDTRAVLSYQGFTGIANLALEGGSRNAPLLTETVPPNGGIPTIQAEVSPFQDILESARNVLTRADSAMAAIDDFITDNGPAFGRSIDNVETFTQALAQNADDIGGVVENVSRAAAALGEMSDQLRGSVTRVEEILNAVEPQKVTEIVDGVVAAAERLDGILARAQTIADGIEAAEINALLDNVTEASASLAQVMQRADQVVTAIDPAEVRALVQAVREASERVGSIATDADRLVKAVDPQRIETIVQSVETATRSIADASTALGPIIVTVRDTFAQVGAVVGAIDPPRVKAVVEDVSAFTARLQGTGNVMDEVLGDLQTASNSLADLGRTIDTRRPDVDAIIVSARQLAEQMNGIAARADGVLQKIDSYVEGDGEGLVVEATAAMRSIRSAADTLNAQIGPITANVANFSDRGLSGITQFVVEGRRALSRLERVLSGVERDPQQFIFGNDGVPEYAPRRR